MPARPSQGLRVGDVERTLPITRDQVHHWVELGLVPAPEKSSATVARYGPSHLVAMRRVLGLRAGGASLAQAARWLGGSLGSLGPGDCETLARWVCTPPGAARWIPADVIAAAVERHLGALPPEVLVEGPHGSSASWIEEFVARWREHEEAAVVRVAEEALAVARSARRRSWRVVDAARSEPGLRRITLLDARGGGLDAASHEERGRLAAMLGARVACTAVDGPWSAFAAASTALRGGRAAEAVSLLGTTNHPLAELLRRVSEALAAARRGDGLLAAVPGLAALRATDPSTLDDPLARGRLRWMAAVTWLALPSRWAPPTVRASLAEGIAEVVAVPAGHPRRATGELDTLEANLHLALGEACLRDGDAASARASFSAAAMFGGTAAREAKRRLRACDITAP